MIAGGETNNVYDRFFNFTLAYSSGRPRHSFWNMAGLTICDLRLEQFRGDECRFPIYDDRCHTGRTQQDTTTTSTRHGQELIHKITPFSGIISVIVCCLSPEPRRMVHWCDQRVHTQHYYSTNMILLFHVDVDYYYSGVCSVIVINQAIVIGQFRFGTQLSSAPL